VLAWQVAYGANDIFILKNGPQNLTQEKLDIDGMMIFNWIL